MEFTYFERRTCVRCLFFTKCLYFLFHLTCALSCISCLDTKYDKIIYYFCLLLSICATLLFTARYEYILFKNNGRVFASIEEFIEWKNQKKKQLMIQYLNGLEWSTYLVFLITTWPLKINFLDSKSNILYAASFFIFQIVGILISFLIVLIGLFSCTFMCCMRSAPPLNVNLGQLPTVEVVINDQMECCICMDKNTLPWIHTPCGHEFHDDCLQNWKRVNNTCPVCRFDI